MVIRVAEFDRAPSFHDDQELLGAFRRWIASQPGYQHGWHAHDSTTGRVISISVWDDLASVHALKTRPFPGGSLGAKPDRVVVYDRVDALSEERSA